MASQAVQLKKELIATIKPLMINDLTEISHVISADHTAA